MISLLSSVERFRKVFKALLELPQEPLTRLSKKSTPRRLFLTEQSESYDQPSIE